METILSRFPAGYYLKGLFLRAVQKELGPDRFEAIRPALLEPPRGAYLPFKDYPQEDYTRLTCVLAELRFPSFTLPEAIRRLSRQDIEILADSMFGRVVMSIVGDARAAMMQIPRVYGVVTSGGWEFGVEPSDRGVAFWIDPHPGDWWYQLGQVEGIVRYYGGTARTIVHAEGARVTLDVGF